MSPKPSPIDHGRESSNTNGNEAFQDPPPKDQQTGHIRQRVNANAEGEGIGRLKLFVMCVHCARAILMDIKDRQTTDISPSHGPTDPAGLIATSCRSCRCQGFSLENDGEDLGWTNDT